MAREKKTKLRGRLRDLASRRIAEEVRTGKYPRAQAVAIGISRARAELKKDPPARARATRKRFLPGEVDSIRELLSRAGRYFLHPDVLTWFPDAAEKEADLQEISRHLETSRRTLKAKDAKAIMLAIQDAANILQNPDNPGQRFALSSSVVAWRLREVVLRLKDFT